MSTRKLSIDQCPVHGTYAISIGDEDGGTRLTSGKCCGRWEEVKSWKMTFEQLYEIVNTLENEMEILDK